MNFSDPVAQEYFSHYREDTLEDFKRFHAENPHIYKRFREMAYKLKKAGRKRYSSKTIICVLRYEHDIKTTGEEFKISDKYQSLYGRLLAYKEPEFKDFFEFIKRKHGGKQ